MKKRLALILTLVLMFSMIGSISASAATKRTTTTTTQYTFMCPVGDGVGLAGTRVVWLEGRYADTFEYYSSGSTIKFKSSERDFYMSFDWNYDESVSLTPYLKGQYGLVNGSFLYESNTMSVPGSWYSGTTHSAWLGGSDDVIITTHTSAAKGRMSYTFSCSEAIIGGIYTLYVDTQF